MDLEHHGAARPKHIHTSLSRRCRQVMALSLVEPTNARAINSQSRQKVQTETPEIPGPPNLIQRFLRPNRTPAANGEAAAHADAIPGNCLHNVMICRQSTAGWRIAPRHVPTAPCCRWFPLWEPCRRLAKKKTADAAFFSRSRPGITGPATCHKRQPTIDCLSAFKRDSSAAGTRGLRLANSSSCEASSSAQSSLEKEVTVWNCCAVKLPSPFHSMSP